MTSVSLTSMNNVQEVFCCRILVKRWHFEVYHHVEKINYRRNTEEYTGCTHLSLPKQPPPFIIRYQIFVTLIWNINLNPCKAPRSVWIHKYFPDLPNWRPHWSLSYLSDAGADPEISAKLLGICTPQPGKRSRARPNPKGSSALNVNIKAMGA